MEKRILGNTGMEVTVLGFGAAEIGYEYASQETVTELINSALDAGLNIIDTAECYMASEEMIGNAVSHRRSEFFLFTKCGHKETFHEQAWDRNSICKSLERSLKRLKMDYVDLLQLHSCSENQLRKGEVIETLQELKKEGKTRYIGYSGDSSAARYAVETGVFDTLQTSVNIADQEALDLTLPAARERNMGVIAKRPVANAVWRFGEKPENEYFQPYWERLRELDYDFMNGSPAVSIAVALRFTLSVPGVHTAIVGTTKPGRWKENAQLLAQGPLPADKFESIRSRWKAIAGPDWVGQI